MSTRNLTIGSEFTVSGHRLDARQRVIYLLLIALAVFVVACESPPIETEQWTPPYLQLQLRAGKVRVKWPDTSEWTTLEDGASITVEERVQIVAGVEGALFHLGDGSRLELGPEAMMEVQNLPSFPRLQMILQDGSFMLVAQKPSYELITPTCSVTLLSIPSQIRVEVNSEATHLAVEDGVVACVWETGTLTLPKCREMYVRPGEEPETSEFCDAGATATAYAMTPSPTSSFWVPETTPTATATPSPTPTPTRAVVIPTSPPLSSTDTPSPPPPPPTNAPPPPPTNAPPPPPTNAPPPPPTSTPPPPPTDTPPPPTSRPTLTPRPPPTDTPRPPPTP